MKPKEKARELILRYLKIENTNEWWSKVPAKQCALIAVDEILNEFPWRPNYGTSYWEEVKLEIEKL